jgi:hypothetical protein
VTAAASATLDDDGLIEYCREAETRPATHWAPAGLLAASFAAVALGALLLPSHRPLRLDALAVTVVASSSGRS